MTHSGQRAAHSGHTSLFPFAEEICSLFGMKRQGGAPVAKWLGGRHDGEWERIRTAVVCVGSSLPACHHKCIFFLLLACNPPIKPWQEAQGWGCQVQRFDAPCTLLRCGSTPCAPHGLALEKSSVIMARAHTERATA